MNTTLYKFQDWENKFHRKSFLESEVFFSNNFSFNDPFDLQLPIITEGEVKFNEEDFIKQHIEERGNPPTKQLLKLAKENWSSIVDESPDIMLKGIKEMKTSSEEIENQLGGFCLSNRYDSSLMWGHYAASHYGYCIGFNKEKLIKHISSKFGKRAQVFEVDYVEEIPKINLEKIEEDTYSLQSAYKRFSSKFIDWKYEKEVRIIIGRFSKQLLKLPKEVYSELIFGYKMGQTEIKEMKIICNSIYPEIKLFKAEPNSNQFGMKKTSI